MVSKSVDDDLSYCMCQVGLPVDAMEGNIPEPEDSRASVSATSFNAVCQFKKKGHVTGGHVTGGKITVDR